MASITDSALLGAAGAAGGTAVYDGYALLSVSGGADGIDLIAFPFSSVSGFGAAINNPSTSPYRNTTSASFTKDGLAVVCTKNSSPYLFAFRWTGSSWGTQYSNPIGGSSIPNDCDVSPSNNFICYPESTVFPVVYSWNSTTGFGSRIRETSNTVGNCRSVEINRAGTVAVFSSSSSPYIKVFPVTSSSIGAPFSNPSPGLSGEGMGFSFNLTDSVLFIATNTSPYIHAYSWSNSTGFGSKYSNPSVLPTSLAFDCAFNPVGGSVALVYWASPYIKAYSWSDSTGFGAAYSNPAAISSNPYRLKFTPDGNGIVAVGGVAPKVKGYAWSNVDGFGTAYSNPTYGDKTANDIDFSPQL